MKTSSALRLDHVAVAVSDAKAAYDLFANVLELPLVAAHAGDDWDNAPWLMMIFELADDGQVALCARRGAKKNSHAATDLPHCALAISNATELNAWEKKLSAAGFSVRREDHGDQHSIYFDDHSGLTWEITTARTQSPRDPNARSTVERWIAE